MNQFFSYFNYHTDIGLPEVCVSYMTWLEKHSYFDFLFDFYFLTHLASGHVVLTLVILPRLEVLWMSLN